MDYSEIFSPDELLALGELGLDPSTLVFNTNSRLPFVKPQQYVCRLKLTDGLYSFDLPPKLPRRFRERVVKIQSKLLAINNATTRKLMESAKKNAEFVERFNKELFLKHSFFQGRRITVSELLDFYETHPYYLTINLSADEDKVPFISLYAMTFYACTPDDLFTVDGIFSIQPERHADNAKKTAGNAVFNLILRNNPDEIKQVLLQMGNTLSNIQPLRVNLDDTVMLSKNYTLFVGLSEIGRVFTTIVGAHETLKNDALITQHLNAAQTLADYAPLAVLCNAIAILGDDENYRDTAAYKKCAKFV
ncbi:MAG: hypothetical protein FWG45_01895 [Oscillospiraceae bacterium]|nr:hypothetical protein [Oscillospiraceae bacterium]